MTQPTDEEIRELWEQFSPMYVKDFARAVLAKWGAPQTAPLSDDTERLREALQRIESASMSMYATRNDMLEHCQDIARAALAKLGAPQQAAPAEPLIRQMLEALELIANTGMDARQCMLTARAAITAARAWLEGKG